MSVKNNMNKIAENSILLILIGSLVAGFVPASVGAYSPVENPITSSSGMNVDEIEPPSVAGCDGSVVDFDDIWLPAKTQETPHIINYAGITWDSGLPDYCRTYVGCWGVWNNPNYATPHSPPNYAYNAYGAINPGFNFVSKVNFQGAYFMTTGALANPSAVRFVGYVGGVPKYYSGELSLSSAPTYLSAGFAGVDRVVVEMLGSGWFAMDDLSYTVAISAIVDIDPETLNLKSEGRRVSCYIELPEGYNVEDIDVSTILLDDVVAAEWGKVEENMLMVKFERQAVIEHIRDALGVRDNNIPLTITGELKDGTLFEGADAIKVVSKGRT